jgi:hypothetical protein
MDQRSSKRNRTFLDGRIIFNNRCSVITCTVRDLSDTGARISFGHIILIPEQFEIEVPKKGLSVSARVIWSRGRDHGVKFITALQDAVPSETREGLQETGLREGNMPEQTGADTAIIHQILDSAQRQIARATGAPVDTIRLKLEIDLAQAGIKKQ